MKLNADHTAVAWRCKDYAGGWRIYQKEADALAYHEATDCLMQALYPLHDAAAGVQELLSELQYEAGIYKSLYEQAISRVAQGAPEPALVETVSPAGLRARAEIVRRVLDESCARHLELAADEIERLRR